MIQVVYHRTYNRLTVEGHALSDEPGRDLICAAASTLALTLAVNVSNMAAQGQVREPTVNLAEGSAEVSCKPNTRFKAVVTLSFDSICVGYELLAAKYPEYIHYEIRQ